jgi:uncharacterized membrane protein
VSLNQFTRYHDEEFTLFVSVKIYNGSHNTPYNVIVMKSEALNGRNTLLDIKKVPKNLLAYKLENYSMWMKGLTYHCYFFEDGCLPCIK